MRNQPKIMNIVLCIVQIIWLFVSPLHLIDAKASPSEQQIGGPPSNRAPDGYVPNQAITPKSVLSGADVLLIQTAWPWNSDADVQVLSALGYSYEIADMSNLGDVDLFSYPVILIVNDQVQAFYDQYATQVGLFEDYVTNGGTLVFFAASDGWASGTLQADLPGGVTVSTGSYHWYNYIVNTTHPIVTRTLSENESLVDADLYSNYCSHGYFSMVPENASVIFRTEDNQPTLIDYQLGRGRVIASTQTWEHNWIYHTGQDSFGPFARKALDDVFLYAFSGGARPANVKNELRVEDALPWTSVNKSRGSYLDVVARVSGDDAYLASVILQVPSDKFGAPVTSFTRRRPGDPVNSQENQHVSLGSGRYQMTSTLESLAGQYYKEMVWRFQVPAGAAPEQNIELAATVSVPEHTVQNATSRAKLNIIDQARSLIVTNRKLLFERYQPNPQQNDVSPLLEDVFVQAWAFDGEVFYVDYYNDAARNWNQEVDYSSEGAANSVATTIDALVDGWYNRLTKSVYVFWKIKPEFLLIVGGDEIIPFYRADDRPYGDDEIRVHIDPDDPVGKVPHQHYLLSDNIYSDIGGGKDDWEKGNLEIAIGRIVGHSAAAMRQFMVNGFGSPTVSTAVLASRSQNHSLTQVRQSLNDHDIKIYGDANPDLTENDQWTLAQWVTALEQPFQVLGYQGHGAYDGWYGPNQWNGASVNATDHPAGQVANNHPLFVVHACNFALPTDLDGTTWNPEPVDNISYRLISLGASGIVASMGLAYTDTSQGVAYGERLSNDYFKYLLSDSAVTEYFGTALLKAKQNYPGNGNFGSHNSTDRKTLTEYVYYGVPWSSTTISESNAIVVSKEISDPGYIISTDVPSEVVPGIYAKSFSISVPTYQFILDDRYELLDIPGSERLYSTFEPVIPLIRTTINLPPGSIILGIELLSEQKLSLGQHAIPSANPETTLNPTTGYTTTTSVTGIYPPEPRYGYSIVDLGNRVEARLAIAPATYNVDTREVTLFDSTVLRVTYQAVVPLALSDLHSDKASYQPGETIMLRTIVDNIGDSTVSAEVFVSILDKLGTVVGTTSLPASDIAPGGSQNIEVPWSGMLPAGNYHAVVSIEQAGTQLVTNGTSFTVQTGRIATFLAPKFVQFGQFGDIQLAFDNLAAAPVEATAKVFIYDSTGSEVASLLQRVLTVDAGSSATFDWNWDPSGLPEGTYSLRAVVQVGSETYTSATEQVSVGPTAPLATVQFSSSFVVTNENDGVATVAVSLNEPSLQQVTVDYVTSDDTALNGVDYVGATGTLTFAPGETTQSFDVPITDDTLDEPDESILLTLSTPGNARPGDPVVASILIADNDNPPAAQFSAMAHNTTENGGPLAIPVNLSTPSGYTATIEYAVGADLTATRTIGQIIFAPGETAQSIMVPITDDALDEPDETIPLILRNPVNATLGQLISATLFIADDDPAVGVQFAGAEHTIAETAGQALISVTLGAASGFTITVKYATADGTGQAGVDYVTASGELTYSPGEMTKSFIVAILDNSVNQPERTVNLLLSDPVNATIGEHSTAMLTIQDVLRMQPLYLPIISK